MTVTDVTAFGELSPTTLADALSREQVMDIGIRPLWQPMPRLAGPAPTSTSPRPAVARNSALAREPPPRVMALCSHPGPDRRE